jgi:SnoaL-like domain
VGDNTKPNVLQDGVLSDDVFAKHAISELIYRYPRGLDRLDKDILLSIGHPTATVDFSTLFKGSWTDFVDWLISAHRPMLFNNHRISNMLIEVDGNRAASETSSTATLLVKRSDGNVEDRLVYSRYLDKWRCDAGRWSIAHRSTIRDFRRVTLISPDVFERSYEYTNASQVCRNDPSYKLFSGGPN